MGEQIKNTEKFSGKADVYGKFRPGYPDALYEYLCKNYLPHGGVAADVGAGTGKFAAGLIKRGIKTFCVEPNADMARVLIDELGSFAEFEHIASPAENIALPEKSVDLVTAAQAFHWFDGKAFYASCKRVLKPGGAVALIWNMRERDAAEQALYALDLEYCVHNFKGRSGGFFNGDDSALREFFPRGWTRTEFENGVLSYSQEQFIGRRLSSSYALTRGEAGYEEYVAALKAHFEKYAVSGKYTERLNTTVYAGEI